MNLTTAQDCTVLPRRTVDLVRAESVNATRRPAPVRVPSTPIRVTGERGMISAEWAVGLIAAISIAGVLIAVITSPAVREALLAVVLRIINFISGITIPG